MKTYNVILTDGYDKYEKSVIANDEVEAKAKALDSLKDDLRNRYGYHENSSMEMAYSLTDFVIENLLSVDYISEKQLSYL